MSSIKLNKGKTTIKYIVLALVIIVFIFTISSTFKSCKKEYVEKKKNKVEQTQSQSTRAQERPSSYTEPYFLQKGKVIRVNIPSGYKCDCSGGGKKYYHQEQNGIKNIMGDGKFHPGGQNAAYIDLSYYNEEITVVCEFTKL